VKNGIKKNIIIETDYQISLYKHWNLFDSLIFSYPILDSFPTFKKYDQKKIKKLFNLLGIPLEQAKQKYCFMKKEYKEIFKRKITEVCGEFGLKNLNFFSFVYQFDEKNQYTASDYVHCLSFMINYFEDNEAIISEDCHNFEEINNCQNIKKNMCQKKREYEKFWVCYNFLSFKSQKNIKKIIMLAIEFKKKIAQQSKIILDDIKLHKNFYISWVKENKENKYLLNSSSILILALLVQYSYQKIQNELVQPKPFILVIQNENEKSYTVASVIGNARESFILKIPFYIIFRMAANKTDSQIKFSSFDKCIIEISKNDFDVFNQEIIKD